MSSRFGKYIRDILQNAKSKMLRLYCNCKHELRGTYTGKEERLFVSGHLATMAAQTLLVLAFIALANGAALEKRAFSKLEVKHCGKRNSVLRMSKIPKLLFPK